METRLALLEQRQRTDWVTLNEKLDSVADSIKTLSANVERVLMLEAQDKARQLVLQKWATYGGIGAAAVTLIGGIIVGVKYLSSH